MTYIYTICLHRSRSQRLCCESIFNSRSCMLLDEEWFQWTITLRKTSNIDQELRIVKESWASNLYYIQWVLVTCGHKNILVRQVDNRPSRDHIFFFRFLYYSFLRNHGLCALFFSLFSRAISFRPRVELRTMHLGSRSSNPTT